MSKFIPIDHKDSDPEYRGLVRKNVESIVGEPLLEVVDRQLLVGRWQVTFPAVPSLNQNPAIYEFQEDGTFSTSYGPEDEEHPSHWRVERGEAMLKTTWCPPIPEYEIEEGTYSGETYHCAWLASGRFVLWNGDDSAVQLFSPISS